jgi:hypothetical protein
MTGSKLSSSHPSIDLVSIPARMPHLLHLAAAPWTVTLDSE